MAGFILKDWYGKEQVFNQDKIFVRDENGELVQFTQGTGESVLESLEVTENGTYTPPDGVDGYNPVTVNVPAPEITLQDKTITENGTYTADSGYDGLGSVTVEVAGSGGGSLEAGLYWRRSDLPSVPSYANYQQTRIALNGKIYALVLPYSGGGNTPVTYVWSETAWTQVVAKTTVNPTPTVPQYLTVYNGKVHIIGSDMTYHGTFNGTAYTQKAALPAKIYENAVTVLNNQLVAYCPYDGNLYGWDEASDTWSVLETIGAKNAFWEIVGLNGTLYGYKSGVLSKRVNGAWTTLATGLGTRYGNMVVMDNCLYFVTYSASTSYALKRFDPVTETCVTLGPIPFYVKNFTLYVYGNRIRFLVGPETIATYEYIAEIVESTE